jgi:hypothetical protein
LETFTSLCFTSRSPDDSEIMSRFKLLLIYCSKTPRSALRTRSETRSSNCKRGRESERVSACIGKSFSCCSPTRLLNHFWNMFRKSPSSSSFSSSLMKQARKLRKTGSEQMLPPLLDTQAKGDVHARLLFKYCSRALLSLVNLISFFI